MRLGRSMAAGAIVGVAGIVFAGANAADAAAISVSLYATNGTDPVKKMVSGDTAGVVPVAKLEQRRAIFQQHYDGTNRQYKLT